MATRVARRYPRCMNQGPQPPICGHRGTLPVTLFSNGVEIVGSRAIPCRSTAAFLVGVEYRCADHLVGLLAAGGVGDAWEVRRLGAPLGEDLDAVLTAAGALCTLDRFQEQHATTAGRIGLIVAQRDQLEAAIGWLNADPSRLRQVQSEIGRQRDEARRRAAKLCEQRRSFGLEPWSAVHADPDIYADMHTPRVGQVIAQLMAPILIGRAAQDAEAAATNTRLDEIEIDLLRLEADGARPQ